VYSGTDYTFPVLFKIFVACLESSLLFLMPCMCSWYPAFSVYPVCFMFAWQLIYTCGFLLSVKFSLFFPLPVSEPVGLMRHICSARLSVIWYGWCFGTSFMFHSTWHNNAKYLILMLSFYLGTVFSMLPLFYTERQTWWDIYCVRTHSYV
jgi:hypothetical protein